MISKKEIWSFWVELSLIQIARFSLSFFGFILLPFALILKYQFGVKDIWLLNDTKDGDFGNDPNWKHYDKPKWVRFFLWFFRNHSWNFIRNFNPEWNAGEAFEYKIIKNTTGKDVKWVWCTRLGTHGTHYIAYRVFEGGKVYCRYSTANHRKERHYGCGGERYKIKRKPLI